MKYEICYSSKDEDYLYNNEEAANIKRITELERVTEQAKLYFEHNWVNCTKKQVWSAGYHKRCIEDANRNIQWHENKLILIKNKEPKS